jgi:hypothetical protein
VQCEAVGARKWIELKWWRRHVTGGKKGKGNGVWPALSIEWTWRGGEQLRGLAHAVSRAAEREKAQ